MDIGTFGMIVDDTQTAAKDMLFMKSAEYASDYDALHNFEAAAALQGVSRQVALAGMMAKHTISIYDMIASDETFSISKWDEKILDHINYLLLLKAILVEETSPVVELNESGFKVQFADPNLKVEILDPDIDPAQASKNFVEAINKSRRSAMKM